MYSKIFTGSIDGADAELVTVETDLSPGLPSVTIVGLPDASVREAKERIRVALHNVGFRFPAKRITVNLSPADIKKEGTHFDLPIAMGVLAASGEICPQQAEGYAFIGELSLDGRINPVQGAIALAIGLRSHGIKQLVISPGNKNEVSILKDIRIYPADNISQVVDHLSGFLPLAAYETQGKQIAKVINPKMDFVDVAGQERVKRAMQVAASAAHNILMIGPPGAGKTMMAHCLSGILPPMTYEECLEVTKIYSLAGKLSGDGLIVDRPFRHPHHTISPIALAGGGVKPKPGEISLAHCGILFLDEFPEFQRKTLEILRQPMENEKIHIARASATVTYPAKIMVVAAMNPCPCGYAGQEKRKCTCSEYQIHRYTSKISGPLADRIDMYIEILPVDYEDLSDQGGKQKKGKTSLQMRNEVQRAREVQANRYKGEGISYNSQLTPPLIKKYCSLNESCLKLFERAFKSYGFTARTSHKIIKMARTIADIDGEEGILVEHLAEAIGYNRAFVIGKGELI